MTDLATFLLGTQESLPKSSLVLTRSSETSSRKKFLTKISSKKFLTSDKNWRSVIPEPGTSIFKDPNKNFSVRKIEFLRKLFHLHLHPAGLGHDQGGRRVEVLAPGAGQVFGQGFVDHGQAEVLVEPFKARRTN